MNFDSLNLYYDVRIAGFDGENFSYSIYIDGDVTEEKYQEICSAVDDFRKPYDEKDIYMGYLDISKQAGRIEIYLDLGNVKPEYEDTSIEGILTALNSVSGIKSVILNEDCEPFENYAFDKMMNFDKLGLYFEVHTANIYGECFDYSIYLDEDVTEEKYQEICSAVDDFRKPYDEKNIYMGYLDISKQAGRIEIYLDLGNVKPEYEDTSIEGILTALNSVSGIKSVILNE